MQSYWGGRASILPDTAAIAHYQLPVVPHKAVAEISKIGNL